MPCSLSTLAERQHTSKPRSETGDQRAARREMQLRPERWPSRHSAGIFRTAMGLSDERYECENVRG